MAADNPQAAMAHVESLPHATVAALRTTVGFAEWMELMHHPLRIDSPKGEIATRVRQFNTYLKMAGSRSSVTFWRALPEPTRLALAVHGGEAVRSFLEESGEAVPLEIKTSGEHPEHFVDAWADPERRNSFWLWLNENPPSHVNADALLELYSRRLLPVPQDDTLPHYIDELNYFFANEWSTPPSTFEPAVTALSELSVRLNAAPRALDATNPAVESYLAEYRRTHAIEDHREYAELTFEEQAELATWVYDTDLTATMPFAQLPADTRDDVYRIAVDVRETLYELATGLLEALYVNYLSSDSDGHRREAH
ncbi:MAG: hypothetical protein H0T78_11345 [Longispora sp.]|nr:hypothetical protein [Longispora sp. (in: high G+C Gram-positive bacteria)]